MKTLIEFCHLKVCFVTVKIILLHRTMIKATRAEFILKIPE